MHLHVSMVLKTPIIVILHNEAYHFKKIKKNKVRILFFFIFLKMIDLIVYDVLLTLLTLDIYPLHP